MRWQDIKSDPKLKSNLEARSRILKAIRTFFDARGYHEMETPLMVAKPGMEPHLDPFKTELQTPTGEKRQAFLITSPEYAMKKLLAAGFTKIYQLGKCFRNGEDSGGRHNPEFTMLEWYRAGTNYSGIMDETEELIRTVAMEAVGKELPGEWDRLSVREAMRTYAGLDLDAAIENGVNDIEAAASISSLSMPKGLGWDDAFYYLFLNAVEPKLGIEKPCFLYDYPLSMAALSKRAKDPRYAERFELYINGLELANAFSELTDADEQRRRLEEERELRKQLGKADHGLDEEFLASLREMPEAGGISIGVDRLVMALLGETDIRRVLAFPTSSMYSPESNR